MNRRILALTTIAIGGLNSAIGPLIFICVDTFVNNITYSFSITEAIMFLFKATLYRKCLPDKGISVFRLNLGLMLIMVWGIFATQLIQIFFTNAAAQRLIAIVVVTFGTLAIAYLL